MSETLCDRFLRFDDKLAKHGVPPLSDWWREEIGAWLDAYEAGAILEFLACVGRGAGKSTAAYKIGLFFLLFAPVVVPPGERHYVVCLSRLKEEASKALTIVAGWLTLLGVPHHVAGDVIDLDTMPRGMRIVAASVAAASGWRAYAVLKDERSKWGVGGAENVDAEEVDTSAAAMTATHPLAPIVTVGSAWGAFGSFYEAVQQGTTSRRIVAGPAATWTAAPHISEDELRRKEPHEARFAREYGCEFRQGWEDGFFPPDLIARCTATWTARDYYEGRRYMIAIDPAFARDLFAICVAHREGERVVIDRVEALTPPKGGALSPTTCMRRVRSLAREYRTPKVLTDQHHAASLIELAGRESVTLQAIAWTATSKSERYETTRVLMREDPPALILPSDAALLRELSGIGTRLLRSGHEQIEARSGYTDDRVSALVLAASSLAVRGHGEKMNDALQSLVARGGVELLARRLGLM